MNAYELANQLAVLAMLNNLDEANTNEIEQSANMLRQQANRIAELEDRLSMYEIKDLDRPQIKELSDEELNKAFDYYCKTDEGVLRFNYELRDEWKKEQLIRWKEAFKKASFTCNGFCGEQECKENQDRCKRIEKASEK